MPYHLETKKGMSSSSHWSRFSLHFIFSAQTVQQPQMEYIQPVWGMFTALHVLYLFKKEASATLRKKPSAQYCSCYIDFFCKGKEGILNPLPKALTSVPEIPLVWVGALSEMSFEEPKWDIFSNVPLLWRIKNISNMVIWKLLD